MSDSETITTRDHHEIRTWAEAHDGRPASVKGTAAHDEAGVLRIDFPGGAGEDELEHISWEDWFAKFDDQDIDFVYQARKADGGDSTFFRLTRRGG